MHVLLLSVRRICGMPVCSYIHDSQSLPPNDNESLGVTAVTCPTGDDESHYFSLPAPRSPPRSQ